MVSARFVHSEVTIFIFHALFFWTIKLFFKRFYFILFFRERGREGKERQRNICVQEIHWSVASCMPPTGNLVCNPGMCPDWELNWWPSGSQAGTQFTDPHQPGQKIILLYLPFFRCLRDVSPIILNKVTAFWGMTVVMINSWSLSSCLNSNISN